jgi:hypothetical protein
VRNVNMYIKGNNWYVVMVLVCVNMNMYMLLVLICIYKGNCAKC